ncbi:hypothetical protein NN4_02410 [Nocardia ninae NBRC 108245]|uniref:Uncharacterized protein n=1 Tax=Nocardia ninae NBRC 108245 TaxID=1210091 RepID=A0A511M506_9NOCA|nr:hypothetical protein NN4_02410 [Nocardia ninae NBRC 108245]
MGAIDGWQVMRTTRWRERETVQGWSQGVPAVGASNAAWRRTRRRQGASSRGEWRVASGEWRVASGEWRVASGEWRVASGEWRVASGEWRVASGEWGVDTESPHLVPDLSTGGG